MHHAGWTSIRSEKLEKCDWNTNHHKSFCAVGIIFRRFSGWFCLQCSTIIACSSLFVVLISSTKINRPKASSNLLFRFHLITTLSKSLCTSYHPEKHSLNGALFSYASSDILMSEFSFLLINPTNTDANWRLLSHYTTKVISACLITMKDTIMVLVMTKDMIMASATMKTQLFLKILLLWGVVLGIGQGIPWYAPVWASSPLCQAERTPSISALS